MKSIIKALGGIVVILIAMMMGCKKDNEPIPAPIEIDIQLQLITKGWVVEEETNRVLLDGVDVTENWEEFIFVLFSNYTYTTIGVHSELEQVWPQYGTWQFKSDTELNTIIRDDGVTIDIIADELTLKMGFKYDISNSRLSSTDGEWRFNLVLK